MRTMAGRTLTGRTLRVGLRTTRVALGVVIDRTVGRMLDTDPYRAR